MIRKYVTIFIIFLSTTAFPQNLESNFPEVNQKEYNVSFLSQTTDMAWTISPFAFKLSSFIREWINKPYKFGGTTKKGIDCSAFARELYRKVMNQYLPRNSRQQFKYVKPINKDDLKTGDLVFFKIKTKNISHVGVYLEDNKFVQSSRQGVNIASLEHPYWKRYFYKAGRL